MLRAWLDDLADAVRGLGARARSGWQVVRAAAVGLVAMLPGLAKVALACGLVLIGLTAFGEPVLFEPLQVPTELKDKLPGEVQARKLVDHVASFGRAVQELQAEKEIRTFGTNLDTPDMEIPGVGVSLRQTIDVSRRALGFREHRISGEVFLSDTVPPGVSLSASCPSGAKPRYLRLRLRSDRDGSLYDEGVLVCATAAPAPASGGSAAPASAAAAAVDPTLLDKLLLQGALQTYAKLNPCSAAAYYYRNWRQPMPDGTLLDPALARAERLVGECLARNDERDAAFAYYLQGMIRQTAGRPVEAHDSFRAAEDLHNSSLLARLRDLASRGLVAMRLPGLPSYLPALYVHWGNSWLDRRSADSKERREEIAQAQTRYLQALARDRDLALAYSGLGNALGELERMGDGRGPAVAAVCVYRIGGKQRRFDATLRHNWGTALDRHADTIAQEIEAGRGWNQPERWQQLRADASVQRWCGRNDPLQKVPTVISALEEAAAKHGKSADLEAGNGRYHAALGFTEAKLATIRRRAGDEAESARRTARAERAFMRALEVTGNESFEAWEGRAGLRLASKDRAGAEAIWQEAAAIFGELSDRRQGGDPWLLYHAARARLSLGHRDAAITNLLGVLERDPSFAPAHLWLARSLDSLQRGPEVLQHYMAVQRLDPGSMGEEDKARLAALAKEAAR
jgi:hypothetical protein